MEYNHCDKIHGVKAVAGYYEVLSLHSIKEMRKTKKKLVYEFQPISLLKMSSSIVLHIMHVFSAAIGKPGCRWGNNIKIA
jgi:hypothetical protein